MVFAKSLLFSEHQRYNFESKSQQAWKKAMREYCCFQNIKDTILKANHNPLLAVAKIYIVVFRTSKIQF